MIARDKSRACMGREFVIIAEKSVGGSQQCDIVAIKVSRYHRVTFIIFVAVGMAKTVSQ